MTPTSQTLSRAPDASGACSPRDLPPWRTVYAYFRTWKSDGTLKRVHDALRAEVRRADGRNHEPGAAVIDRQSAQTTESGGRGYDAGKNVEDTSEAWIRMAMICLTLRRLAT